MADYDYCPNCDNLVEGQSGVCKSCDNKTIRFEYRIETRMNIFKILLASALIFYTAFYILFEYRITLVLTSLIVFIIFVIGIFIVVSGLNQALKKGQKLYKTNREEYDIGEGLDLRKRMIGIRYLSWIIRHVDGLLTVIIFCIIMVVVMILIVIFFQVYLSILISILFIIAAIFISVIYTPAKKLNDLVIALEKDLIEVHSVKSQTIKLNTQRFGEFFVYSSGSYYKVWIRTTKKIPVAEDRRKAIWNKPSFFERNSKKDNLMFPELVSPYQLEEIETLIELRFEKDQKPGRIMGILNDRILRTEIPDILKTVALLREIEGRL
jgi:hypothetical protein